MSDTERNEVQQGSPYYLYPKNDVSATVNSIIYRGALIYGDGFGFEWDEKAENFVLTEYLEPPHRTPFQQQLHKIKQLLFELSARIEALEENEPAS